MGQFEPNNTLSVCCPYDTVVAGFGNLSDFASVVEFFTYGNKYRVRQSGSIKRVRLYVAAAVSTLKVRIWRQVGTKFDLVATTDELAGSAIAGQINSFDLATPLAVEEGDFYSVQVRGTGGATPVSCLHAKTGQTGVTAYLRIGGASPTQFDWLVQDPIGGAANPVELYSQSPSFAFIGDSIIAGFTDHQSYLHTSFSHSPGTTIERQFADLTGFSYQNMGVGGNRADQVLSRLTADCIALNPRAAVILVGVNDVSQGRTLSQYTADLTSILTSLVSAGIVPVPLATLPWSAGSNAQAQQIEAFNAALRSVVASFPTARLIDARSRVGQFRSGGPPGNLWDMAAEFNSGDNVHWNSEGHRQLALALRDELTLTAGPYLMVASRVVTSIVDNQAPYVQKNGTATFLARVVSWDGLPIRQADVAAAQYTVSMLDPNNPDQEAAIPGHEAVDIAVASTVSDTPRLDGHWTHDPWGYNFRHTIDVNAAPAFSLRGRRHLVRFTLRPTAQGNQPVHLDFPVFVR